MSRSLIAEAWRALTAYRRRSILTMLGIGWGITTLVMLSSYGSGFQGALNLGFEAFGTNLFFLWSGTTSEQAGGQRAGRQIRMQIEDLDYVQTTVPTIRQASPQVTRNVRVVSASRHQEFDVSGVYPVFGAIRRMSVEQGRWLDAGDEASRGRVVVIGSSVRERLFGGQPAVGEALHIGGLSFQVVGVLKNKPGPGGDDNRQVFMPFSSMGLLFPIRYIDSIVLQTERGVPHKAIVKQIRSRLGERLGFRPTDEQALNIYDAQEDLDNIRIITAMINVLMAVIGGITLAIGGVGVMNIMLVSVTQRTREIGILKSLGARRRHILAQFLAEALLIAFLGGVLGMALSYFLAWMIPPLPLWSAVTGDTSREGDIILRVGWQALLLAGGLLSAVGLAAGFWPAVRAARLDPVEALRYE